MSFKRERCPQRYAEGDELTSHMIGIGMMFSGKPSRNPNIENTLVAASIEAFEKKDGRVRSMLADWFHVYHQWVNADRLISLVLTLENDLARRYWCALSQWKCKDTRFKRLAGLYADRADLSPSSWRLIEMRGEDERFQNTCLRIPKGFLRSNSDKYIFLPSFLVKSHRVLKYRMMIGPTYRADMWARLSMLSKKRAIALPCAELARFSYGSYATANRVKNEWLLVNRDKSV